MRDEFCHSRGLAYGGDNGGDRTHAQQLETNPRVVLRKVVSVSPEGEILSRELLKYERPSAAPVFRCIPRRTNHFEMYSGG